MNDAKKILEIKSVTAGYEENIILKDVNLVVYEKDFLGIIGPNGGGKTTLLKVILGIIQPIKGSVEFFFEKSKNAKKFIGYLPQFNLNDKEFPIIVMDVVLSGLMTKIGFLQKISASDRENAEMLLKKMGVFHLKKKTLGELSGGQIQRVFLCRALVSSPKLLILDEPNAFVDEEFKNNFHEILKELNKKMAIILVSHDIGAISSYVKNIACVNNTLFYHGAEEITQGFIDKYKCPVDMITHGDIPHRVLKKHGAE
ncbi:MAG: ABC transporter ATP-binding protein [Spirochaetes bacterium]|nr:ABC transporter ATP-binding protein [Spirochaetota bacterium]